MNPIDRSQEHFAGAASSEQDIPQAVLAVSRIAASEMELSRERSTDGSFGAVDEISNLVALQRLDLFDSQLTSLPPNVVNLDLAPTPRQSAFWLYHMSFRSQPSQSYAIYRSP